MVGKFIGIYIDWRGKIHMRIGLLITSIGNFGQKGFYNSQEIGLAKALDQYFKEVILYKLVSQDQDYEKELICGCKNAYLQQIPSKHIGINGLLNCDILDESLDVLVYFSDTQISVPRVYRWAKKKKVQFYPYIGVLESHSTNALKRFIMNIFIRCNINVYRKSHCMVKTPIVEKELRKMGVTEITIVPVGLDVSLLYQGYESIPKNILKQKYGYQDNNKVILFIGRLIDEKQPERMIQILKELLQKDGSYRLLMVGRGPLKERVDAEIRSYGISEYVMQIDKMANNDIWELYRIADYFVNLNQQEIFGMSILEALFYQCKVIALEAPGPNLILKEESGGSLVSSTDDIVEKILNESEVIDRAINTRKYIMDNFTWEATVKSMIPVIKQNNAMRIGDYKGN